MLLQYIDPFVRQILIGGVGGDCSKDDLFTWIKTHDCRLFFITEGSGNMIFEDATYELHAGAAILFQSGTKYIWDTNECKFIVVNFDYTMNYSHITDTFHPVRVELYDEHYEFEHIEFEDATELNTHIYVENAHDIESFLRELSSAYYIKDTLQLKLMSSYLTSIILTVLRNARLEGRISNKTYMDRNKRSIKKVIDFIQNNYTQDLTNETIAKSLHYNPSYINRLFRKNVGTTIHQFLVNYRINMAMELLRTQNDSIGKIAADVGFSDIAHFVKSFKKQTGKTPKQYRLSSD